MALDLNDKTANGNTLTNVNTVTEWTTDLPFATGNTRAAALVRTSTQQLTFDDSVSTSITGDITLEAWIKFDSLGSEGYIGIIAKGTNDGSSSYLFSYQANGSPNDKLALFISNDGTANDILAVNWQALINTWYHVAVAWKASTKTAQFTVNSSQQGTDQIGTATSIFNGVTGGSIGGPNFGTNYFNGKIDDVRIYNVARTISNIASDYNRDLTTPLSSEVDGNNLVAYWSFETLLAGSTTSTSISTSTSSTTTSQSTSTTTSLAYIDDTSYLFDGTTVSDRIQALTSNGFQLGINTQVNSNGVIYYYFVFKKDKQFFDIGRYTGNGINNTPVGTIWMPEMIWIQKRSGSTQTPVWATLTSIPTSTTLRFGNTTVLTDGILDLGSFTLGTNVIVNNNGDSYDYFIWKNSAQSDFTYKYYEYRIFNGDSYITSWTKEVLSEPRFHNIINGGPSEIIVKLARNFDDFGENVDVTLNYRVDIWVYDREYPNGQRLYRGFISGYRPVLDGNTEYVEITVLSYVFQLSYTMLRDGTGATTVPYFSQDPSDILKDIILKYRADGGVINYTADSIQTTGTTVSYTFNSNTVKEAIDKVIELAPVGWYWTVDSNSIIYLKPLSTTATHTFTIGTHVNYMETWRRIEDVVNRVYFTGFTTASGSGMFRIYSNTGSISSYGLHAINQTDGRVTNTSTADTIANRILNAKNAPEIRTAIVIEDSNGENQYRGYDIESIVPGDTMKITNIKGSVKTYSRWDQFIWDVDVWDQTLTTSAADVIQILSLDYEPNKIRIEASSRLPEVSKRIEDIDRNLTANITKDNPSSPTVG